MPTHPRSYSPAAAEKLRRALLALAAASTAVAAAPGCTLSGARPQKPDETVPPVLDDNRQPPAPIDDIRDGQQIYVPGRIPPPQEPRVAGAPVPPPRAAVPPAGREAGSVPGASAPGAVRALPPKAGFTVYTIQPGDTLSAIAQRHQVLQKSIVEANGLADPNRIRAGRQLYIPTEKDPSYTQRTAGRFLFAP